MFGQTFLSPRNEGGDPPLPRCLARVTLPREEHLFFCAHPAVETENQRVTAEFCLQCDRWREPVPATLRPLPRIKNVLTWAVGVTTAPRAVPTLGRTLESLVRAGWDHARLFVEPGVDIPRRFAGWPKTVRDEPLGAYPNWYLGLAELVMRQPRAEAYFMLQDDVVFARGLREWLEYALWPAENCGAVSAYDTHSLKCGQCWRILARPIRWAITGPSARFP
jgi:hypothetical protein